MCIEIEYDLVDEIKNKMPESDLKYVLIDLLKVNCFFFFLLTNAFI